MTTVYKSITQEVDIDVDIELDLSDIYEFIDDSDDETLELIVARVEKKNMEIRPLLEFDAATIRHLIERANIFGIEDMMDDLKREGERIGVYLSTGGKQQ